MTAKRVYPGMETYARMYDAKISAQRWRFVEQIKPRVVKQPNLITQPKQVIIAVAKACQLRCKSCSASGWKLKHHAKDFSSEPNWDAQTVVRMLKEAQSAGVESWRLLGAGEIGTVRNFNKYLGKIIEEVNGDMLMLPMFTNGVAYGQPGVARALFQGLKRHGVMRQPFILSIDEIHLEAIKKRNLVRPYFNLIEAMMEEYPQGTLPVRIILRKGEDLFRLCRSVQDVLLLGLAEPADVSYDAEKSEVEIIFWNGFKMIFSFPNMSHYSLHEQAETEVPGYFRPLVWQKQDGCPELERMDFNVRLDGGITTCAAMANYPSGLIYERFDPEDSEGVFERALVRINIDPLTRRMHTPGVGNRWLWAVGNELAADQFARYVFTHGGPPCMWIHANSPLQYELTRIAAVESMFLAEDLEHQLEPSDVIEILSSGANLQGLLRGMVERRRGSWSGQVSLPHIPAALEGRFGRQLELFAFLQGRLGWLKENANTREISLAASQIKANI